MRRRGVAANSAFALAADLAAKASMVVVTAVAARSMSTQEFALFATCLAAASLLTSGLDAGAQTLLTRDGAAGRAARGSLFRALALARTPIAGAGLAATVVVGIVLGRPLEAVVTFVLALVLAVGLSLSGLLRSAQDLRPEAESKLLTGFLSVALFVPAAFQSRNAAVLLATLAAGSGIGLWPLVRAARKAGSFEPSEQPRRALRSALPLGLLSLATIVYYRSGVIALSLLGSSKETASYAVAANLAFGLLTIPNAVTTGLLPRLAAERSDTKRVAVARRALWWTVVFSGTLVIGAALLSPTLLGLLFGDRYTSAARPLVLLTIGVFIIALSGILGTFLVAAGSLRPLGAQVALSLAVNLATLAALVPALGVTGAALATIVCEFAGLLVLVAAVSRTVPRLTMLGALRPRMLPRAPEVAHLEP